MLARRGVLLVGAAACIVLTAACAPVLGLDSFRYTADGGAPPRSIMLGQVVTPGDTSGAGESEPVLVTAGDLLVVAVYWDNDSAHVTVTDALGNTWAPGTEQSNPGNGQVQIWYAENAKGGADTVTVTQDQPSNYMGFYLLEYGGILPTGSLDAENGQIATLDTNAMQTGPLTTTGPLDVIVAVFSDTCGVSGLIAAGPGFVAESADRGFDTMVEDNAPGGVTPGMQSATATLPGDIMSHCWAATAAAFKAR
jgi:hypothetical protein